MTDVTADFAKRLDQTAEDTEALLAKLLSDALLPDEIARPKRLMDAMRYSSLGDGLLTLAFDIVTRDEIHKDPTVRLLLTRALARASGIGGMVGGQMLDLAG